MALLSTVATPLHASTFWLATVTAPITLELQSPDLLGPFDHHLLFTVAADHPLSFSAFVASGIGRRSTIPDMEGPD